VSGSLRVRQSARVVLLDDRDRVLLLQIHDLSVTRGPNPIPADFWLLVGGGVEMGETHEQAAQREVFEETGLRVTVGRCVGTQEKIVADMTGEVIHAKAQFFVARVPSDPVIQFGGCAPAEASTILGYRWFTREEVVERQANEYFAPPHLPELLAAALALPPTLLS
jgi:8-oxo-dGTP pyrophosphatase MutT (NUDIX family)